MLEPTLKWTRSKSCSDNACVEVAWQDDRVLLRDAKNPERPFVAFSFGEWASFLNAIRAGRFAPKRSTPD
jgi:hypothetical protein